jgi:hypothetical protein
MAVLKYADIFRINASDAERRERRGEQVAEEWS